MTTLLSFYNPFPCIRSEADFDPVSDRVVKAAKQATYWYVIDAADRVSSAHLADRPLTQLELAQLDAEATTVHQIKVTRADESKIVAWLFGFVARCSNLESGLIVKQLRHSMECLRPAR